MTGREVCRVAGFPFFRYQVPRSRGGYLLSRRLGWDVHSERHQSRGQQVVSMSPFEQLKALADGRKCSVLELVNAAFSGVISNLLKSAPRQLAAILRLSKCLQSKLHHLRHFKAPTLQALIKQDVDPLA